MAAANKIHPISEAVLNTSSNQTKLAAYRKGEPFWTEVKALLFPTKGRVQLVTLRVNPELQPEKKLCLTKYFQKQLADSSDVDDEGEELEEHFEAIQHPYLNSSAMDILCADPGASNYPEMRQKFINEAPAIRYDNYSNPLLPQDDVTSGVLTSGFLWMKDTALNDYCENVTLEVHFLGNENGMLGEAGLEMMRALPQNPHLAGFRDTRGPVLVTVGLTQQKGFYTDYSLMLDIPDTSWDPDNMEWQAMLENDVAELIHRRYIDAGIYRPVCGPHCRHH
jgi:hypothetical protein